MPDEQNNPTPEGNGGGAPKDAAYWEAEAKKAFQDRDAAKKRAKELEGKVLTDEQATRYQELETAAAKAEDERKRKAGEFDQWRADILKKHTEELAKRDERLTAAERQLQDTRIGYAFAGATDLFGKEAFTIYGPKAGERIFREFVTLDNDGTPIVKDLTGNVILDAKTGKPASFVAGLRELIESLPDKNEHLRGSGKAGSGNSGGAPGGPNVLDFRNLTPDQRRDPKVLAALRASLPKGGVVMGEAYER